MHRRVRHGMRRRHNWCQLVRFGVVGASGYVVNLAIYALVLALGCTTAAPRRRFLVGGDQQLLVEPHWTFDARDGHAGFQAARFFVVSVVAFVFSLAC